jgi:hypothetical protein
VYFVSFPVCVCVVWEVCECSPVSGGGVSFPVCVCVVWEVCECSPVSGGGSQNLQVIFQ